MYSAVEAYGVPREHFWKGSNMGKADRYIEKQKCQNSQLNPFKNRKKYDFIEMIEHSKNQNRFVNKIINRKLK